MSELNPADQAVDRIVEAIEDPNQESSNALLDQANQELAEMSEPERAYVQNTLANRGLLPDLAIETGLVGDNQFATRDELAEAGQPGNSTVEGMAASFLADNYSTIGGHRHDIDSGYVEGFDIRLDMAVETARAMREFPGLLETLKQSNPDNAEIQARDGLQQEDVDALLANPEALTDSQKEALGFMKQRFEYLKTPRGIWTITDWTTPRITSQSIDDFVNTGLPMGFRPHLEMVQQDYARKDQLEQAARDAAGQRQHDDTPEQSVLPGDQDPTTPGEIVPPRDQSPDEFGPNRVVQDNQQLPRDEKPDEFGPNRQLFPPDSERQERSTEKHFFRFDEQGQEGSSQTEEYKTLKLKQSMSVEDFARWQLGGQASSSQVDALSQQLIDANENFQDSSSMIEAGTEFRVPGDMDVAAPGADEKFIRIGKSITVDDFARSQLGEDAAEADVDALRDKIVAANDGLDNGSSVIEADSVLKVPSDLELKAIEPDHKSIKLNRSMTVQELAKSQLAEDASEDDVRALAERIAASNDGLASPDATIEAGQEVRVPADLEVKAIRPDYKMTKLPSAMTVEDFARSQLAPDASDDDVRALTEKITTLNDDLSDGSSMIDADREVKIPRELELNSIDTVYEVVPGDNLWKISRRHLTERDGSRPSNAEVLQLVNEIVDRNSIENPDLIYPEQKFVIPGQTPEEIEPEPEMPEEIEPEPVMPEEVEPPEETEPEPEGSEERQRLVELAEERYADEPDTLSDFKENMEAFERRAETEGLSEAEVSETYREISRLLEYEGDTPTTPEQRERLARQIMAQAANPYSIDQGRHNTCNMNTVEVRTYKRNPADAAKLVTDIATTGSYTTREGAEIEIDAQPHNESKNEVDYDGSRTHASEIFQVTAVNIYLHQRNHETDPPGQLRYEEHDKVPGTVGSGERLVDYSQTPPEVIGDSPDVHTGRLGVLRDTYASITGERETEIVLGHRGFVSDTSDAVRRISTEEELNTYLAEAKSDGKLPIIVGVHTANEPFWTDSGGGAAGGSGGGHVITITDFQEGPPAQVTIDNSWGSDDDHDASDPVSTHDLFMAMQRPRDAVDDMRSDVEDARDAGSPDFWKEFELVRLRRVSDMIDDDNLQEEIIDAMDRAKEHWDEHPPDAEERQRALDKLTDMIRGMDPAIRTAVQAHRDSLGL